MRAHWSAQAKRAYGQADEGQLHTISTLSATAMSVGRALDGTIWSGWVFKAKAQRKYVCLIPPQQTMMNISGPHHLRKNHLVMDGANMENLPGGRTLSLLGIT